MIKQHCIGSGRDCDRSTIDLLWLIHILDGGQNDGFYLFNQVLHISLHLCVSVESRYIRSSLNSQFMKK